MREAFAFLTVLGRSTVPSPRTLRWFPVVGCALGAAVGACWWSFDQVFPAMVAAALAVAVDLALTGMLHVDGLADSADGLLPHLPRERRLEVMRAPDVGAFGVAVVAGVLVLRVVTLASRDADVLLLMGVWCASRALVATATGCMPYARDSGIASAFVDDRRGSDATSRRPWAPIVAVVPAAALAGLGIGWIGVSAVAATVVVGSAVLALAFRRIGGFTGDVLGAAVVIGETAGLVAATARW